MYCHNHINKSRSYQKKLHWNLQTIRFENILLMGL